MERHTDRAEHTARSASAAVDERHGGDTRVRRIRAALRRERAQATRELDRLDAASAEHHERVGTRDPCARGSPAVIEEEDLHAWRTARARRAEQALNAIDDALRRLDRDPAGYGACEACGGPIGEERLGLLPAARRCAACAD